MGPSTSDGTDCDTKEGRCLAEAPPSISFAGQSHLLMRSMVRQLLGLQSMSSRSLHRLGKTWKQRMELGDIPEESAQA